MAQERDLETITLLPYGRPACPRAEITDWRVFSEPFFKTLRRNQAGSLRREP